MEIVIFSCTKTSIVIIEFNLFLIRIIVNVTAKGLPIYDYLKSKF